MYPDKILLANLAFKSKIINGRKKFGVSQIFIDLN